LNNPLQSRFQLYDDRFDVEYPLDIMQRFHYTLLTRIFHRVSTAWTQAACLLRCACDVS